MITRDDVVIALSNSGNTAEILALLPLLKRLAVPVIAMTGNRESPLAKAADVHLYAGVTEEACPLDLAPTSSTTAAMVMGDALAIALLETRDLLQKILRFHIPGDRWAANSFSASMMSWPREPQCLKFLQMPP